MCVKNLMPWIHWHISEATSSCQKTSYTSMATLLELFRRLLFLVSPRYLSNACHPLRLKVAYASCTVYRDNIANLCHRLCKRNGGETSSAAGTSMAGGRRSKGWAGRSAALLAPQPMKCLWQTQPQSISSRSLLLPWTCIQGRFLSQVHKSYIAPFAKVLLLKVSTYILGSAGDSTEAFCFHFVRYR